MSPHSQAGPSSLERVARRLAGPLLACLVLVGPAGGVAARAAAPAAASGARSLSDYFQQGNEAYLQGRYAEAVEAYQRVTRYGVRDADLEHNLGNAQLRAGRIGEAVLHYERALRLQPRARDTARNLAVARSRIAGGAALQLVARGVRVGEGTDAAWVEFFRLATPDEAAVALLLLEALACGLLLWRRRQAVGTSARTVLAWSGGGAAALALLVAAYLGGQLWAEHSVQLGVVLEPAAVREGPAAEAAVLFQAPAGVEVRLEPSPTPGWRALRINEELRGFVPAAAVAPIEPF